MNRKYFRHIGIVLIVLGFILMATGNILHIELIFILQEILGAALMLIGFIKALSKQENKPISIEKKSIFVSVLPEDVDWDEINLFLKTTDFYKRVLSDSWRDSDFFNAYPLSDTSMKCLSCLHEDLRSCYGHIFAIDENGNEDRHEEYRLLKENLDLKYEKIDEENLKRIYYDYLQQDR